MSTTEGIRSRSKRLSVSRSPIFATTNRATCGRRTRPEGDDALRQGLRPHSGYSYLDACIHCGMCAIRLPLLRCAPRIRSTRRSGRLEPFKQAYKREAGPMAPLYRLFGLKKKVTVEAAGRMAAPAL